MGPDESTGRTARRTRVLAWAGAVLAAGLAAIAGPGSAGAADATSPPPTSGRRLAERLSQVAQRVDILVARANEDDRFAQIDRYLAMTAQDFAKRNRDDPSAKALVGWMRDESAPEVRKRAKDALLMLTRRTIDPDLKLDQGKRASFSRTWFLPMIGDGKSSEWTRASGHEILLSFWPSARDPDIQRYSPREEKTWGPARNAWLRYLQGK